MSQVWEVHDGPTVVADSEALLTGASADNTVDPEVLSILSTDAIVESLVDSEELFTGVAVESMADSVILLEKRAGMAGSNVLFADPAVERVTGSEKVLLEASFESGESPADSAVIFSVLELAELAEIVGIRFELVDLPVDEAGLVISAEVTVMAILVLAAVMVVLFLFWFSTSVILPFDKLSAGLPCLARKSAVSFPAVSLVFSVLIRVGNVNPAAGLDCSLLTDSAILAPGILNTAASVTTSLELTLPVDVSLVARLALLNAIPDLYFIMPLVACISLLSGLND